jgi:hypothetical protein
MPERSVNHGLNILFHYRYTLAPESGGNGWQILHIPARKLIVQGAPGPAEALLALCDKYPDLSPHPDRNHDSQES